MGWHSTFGKAEDMNRAERRKADQDYRRMMRRNRRAQARIARARSNPKKED